MFTVEEWLGGGGRRVLKKAFSSHFSHVLSCMFTVKEWLGEGGRRVLKNSFLLPFQPRLSCMFTVEEWWGGGGGVLKKAFSSHFSHVFLACSLERNGWVRGGSPDE